MCSIFESFMFKSLVASVAVFVCLLGPQMPAKANIRCTHNDYMGTTTCSTPNGTVRGSHNEYTDTTTWSGPNGTLRCTHNDYMGTTNCY